MSDFERERSRRYPEKKPAAHGLKALPMTAVTQIAVSVTEARLLKVRIDISDRVKRVLGPLARLLHSTCAKSPNWPCWQYRR
jgi:hypothetical protein